MNPKIEKMSIWLWRHYHIRLQAFFPVAGGEDPFSENLRIIDAEERSYFVKISNRKREKSALLLTKLVGVLGDAVIAPIKNLRGCPSTHFFEKNVTVFPFIVGTNGFTRDLSLTQMRLLGQMLRRLHNQDILTFVPEASRFRISENHLNHFAEEIEYLGQRAPDCVRMLEPYRNTLSQLMAETRSLLKKYRKKSDSLVLCHTDLHAGNLLLEPSGAIRIVDWDGARIGPAEADLMMFGAGIGGKLSDPVLLAAFWEGYGRIKVDVELVRLLRYLRIIEDLSLFLARITDPETTESRRNLDIGYVLSNFSGGNTIDCAKRNLGPWI